MMTDELMVVEGEYVNLGAIRALGPVDVVRRASAIASELARVIEDRKLYATIKGRKHVLVEGWSTLGAMLGVMPRELSTERQEDGGYIAKVELVRVSDGMVVGAGSALCGVDEKRWSRAEEYARRSMAITRATGKAYRLGFSWIVTLAGYEPTPAEEMPGVHTTAPRKQPAQSATASTEPAQDISYGILNAVTNAGLTDNLYSFNATLAKFTDLDTGDLDAVTARFTAYRAARKGGMDTDQAARVADAACYVLKDGSILGDDRGVKEWSSMVEEIDAIGGDVSDRIRIVKAHCLTLIEVAEPAPLDGKALREQWASLYREAERLGLEVEPIKGDATDEQVAARIDGLAPLVAGAEAEIPEEEKSND